MPAWWMSATVPHLDRGGTFVRAARWPVKPGAVSHERERQPRKRQPVATVPANSLSAGLYVVDSESVLQGTATDSSEVP